MRRSVIFHKFGKENISAAEMEKRKRAPQEEDQGYIRSFFSGQQKSQRKHISRLNFKLGESVKVLSMNLTGYGSSSPS